jgi:hypothetical protein
LGSRAHHSIKGMVMHGPARHSHHRPNRYVNQKLN